MVALTMLPTSATLWFEQTNNAIGMVTFATVFYMFESNIWQLDRSWHPRTWVRLMIYLDALGFLILYSGNLANDALPLCSQRNLYLIVADLVWCCKDAVKYGYIAFRAMTICGFKSRNQKLYCYLVASGSAVLYWILMGQVYSFKEPDCKAHFQSNIPRVTLYVYWTVVDIAAAALIVIKMQRAVFENDTVLGNTEDGKTFWIIKFREELRLVFVAIGMCAVTIVVIVQTTHPEMPTYRVGTMVFVFCQLILVIGSRKVEVGEASSGAASGKRSGGSTQKSRSQMGTIIRGNTIKSVGSAKSVDQTRTEIENSIFVSVHAPQTPRLQKKNSLTQASNLD
ncbi:hypothetical protein BDR26DRAFT_522087 [Obelidium mucronatum]|nr:hypothetical protein BDR26DRAFT_522087 [Obelidium mucronatum]